MVFSPEHLSSLPLSLWAQNETLIIIGTVIPIGYVSLLGFPSTL